MSRSMNVSEMCRDMSFEIPQMIANRLGMVGVRMSHTENSRWIQPVYGIPNHKGRAADQVCGVASVIEVDAFSKPVPSICFCTSLSFEKDLINSSLKNFCDVYESTREKIANSFGQELMSLVMPMYNNKDSCQVEVHMRRPFTVKCSTSYVNYMEIIMAEGAFSVFSPDAMFDDEWAAEWTAEPENPNIMDLIADKMMLRMEEET